MGSVNVLILNVFNIYQEQSGWNGRLREEKARETSAPTTFEDVIELSPKDGVWEAAYEEIPSLAPHNSYLGPPEKLTYNRRGGFAPSPPSIGLRVNLVV